MKDKECNAITLTDEEKKDLNYKISVMTACVSGKEIQVRVGNYDNEWADIERPHWNWEYYDYRIKPYDSYRPFQSSDEVLAAITEHGDWVRVKHEKERFYKLVYFTNDQFSVGNNGFNSTQMLNRFEFADGTPFGVKEKTQGI